eukprot:347470_1
MHVPSGQMMPPTAQTISQCRLLNCCRRQVMMSSKQTPVMTPVSSTSEIPVSGEHTENDVPKKEPLEDSATESMSSHEASGPESLETEPFSPPKDRMECLSVAVSAVERSTRSKSKKRRPRKQTGKLKTTAAGFEEKWFNCNLCGNFKRVPLRGVNGHKVQHNCTAASQCVYIIGKAYSADQKGRNADQVVVRGKREPAVYNYVAPEGGNSSSHSQDSQSSRSKRAEL